MINFEGYQDTPLYTQEQIRKVVENVASTLKFDLKSVSFQDKMETVIFHLNEKNGKCYSIDARLSLDVQSRQPKIIINYKNLEGSWFYNIFDEKFNLAQERAAVIYLKKRLGFVSRVSTLLEFLETEHSVIVYLMARNEMTKKICHVTDITESEQLLFELMCFKVFSDQVVSTAESVQDLIDNFDKHIALSDMKNI
jgi:hypothetical protein